MGQIKKVLEIRVTFTEKQQDLFKYIKDKSSASAFLKDLAQREMLRDNMYINSVASVIPQQVILQQQIQPPQQPIIGNVPQEKKLTNEFEFDADDFNTDEFDFDTDDLDF